MIPFITVKYWIKNQQQKRTNSDLIELNRGGDHYPDGMNSKNITFFRYVNYKKQNVKSS